MTIIRRRFLAGIFAACAGPAIVRAESLMRIASPAVSESLCGYLVSASANGERIVTRVLWASEKRAIENEYALCGATRPLYVYDHVKRTWS